MNKMNFKKTKLQAEKMLSNSRLAAVFVLIIYYLLKIANFTVISFSFLCIYNIYKADFFFPVKLPVAIYYDVFAICVLVCLYFLTLLKYLKNIWFFENSNNGSQHRYFKIIPVRLQFKIIFLHLFKNVNICLTFVFSAVPFSAFSYYFYLNLNKGMPLYFVLIFTLMLILLLGLSIYFTLLNSLRFNFLDEEIYLNGGKKLFLIYKKCIRDSKNKLFNILMFKLSFIFWFLSCILIVPVFYVMPYYSQSLSQKAKQVLHVYSARPVKFKPVIFEFN